ncbi:MAG: hypothetical protein V1829_01715 [bacterium]
MTDFGEIGEMMKQTTVLVRYYGQKPNTAKDNLLPIIERNKWAGRIIFGINVDYSGDTGGDQSGALDFLKKIKDIHSNVMALPIRPWGKKSFVGPLNALLTEAASDPAATYVFLHSAETIIDRPTVKILMSYMEGDVLVVGPELPGHDWISNDPEECILVKEATGAQIPWGTCMLVRLDKILPFGFQLIGDFPRDIANAGVEEYVAFAMIHYFNRENNKIFLVRVPDVGWDTNYDDPERKAWQKKKIESKASRPALQLAQIPGLKPPEVIHQYHYTYNV